MLNIPFEEITYDNNRKTFVLPEGGTLWIGRNCQINTKPYCYNTTDPVPYWSFTKTNPDNTQVNADYLTNNHVLVFSTKVLIPCASVEQAINIIRALSVDPMPQKEGLAYVNKRITGITLPLFPFTKRPKGPKWVHPEDQGVYTYLPNPS